MAMEKLSADAIRDGLEKGDLAPEYPPAVAASHTAAPFLELVKECMHAEPHRRPGTHNVCARLERAKRRVLTEVAADSMNPPEPEGRVSGEELDRLVNVANEKLRIAQKVLEDANVRLGAEAKKLEAADARLERAVGMRQLAEAGIRKAEAALTNSQETASAEAEKARKLQQESDRAEAKVRGTRPGGGGTRFVRGGRLRDAGCGVV